MKMDGAIFSWRGSPVMKSPGPIKTFHSPGGHVYQSNILPALAAFP